MNFLETESSFAPIQCYGIVLMCHNGLQIGLVKLNLTKYNYEREITRDSSIQ